MKKLMLTAIVCAACIDWTRFTGTVKAINLKASTVTLQLKGGDIITVPVDYQVKVLVKGDQVRGLKDLALDEKATLLRVPSDAPPPEDTTGMALPEKR